MWFLSPFLLVSQWGAHPKEPSHFHFTSQAVLWPTVEDPIAAWHFTVMQVFASASALTHCCSPQALCFPCNSCTFLWLYHLLIHTHQCQWTLKEPYLFWRRHFSSLSWMPPKLSSLRQKMFFYQSLYHFTVYRFMLLVHFSLGYVFAITPLHQTSQKNSNCVL